MAARLLYLSVPALAAALSTGATVAPKTALRSLFSPPAPDEVLACPLPGKEGLRTEAVVIGGERSVRKTSASGIPYPVRTLPSKNVYSDLLPTAGRNMPLSIDELTTELQDAWGNRVQTSLFRSPLVSFLYERGWRENFKNAGFPGIDKEYEEVREFFAPVATDGVVVDMSCGSGLMTRRLLRSGAYRRVLALDYSESMLTETARRVAEEGLPVATLTLCRADVAALPLRPGSVDAMHAGAAMHCWPKLEEGLQEIRQSLRPGGRFFATTFLQGAYGAAMPRQTGGASFRFFEDEAELKALLVAAGFPEAGVSVRREGRGCAVIKAEVLEEAAAEAAAEPTTEAAEERKTGTPATLDDEPQEEPAEETDVDRLIDAVDAMEG